MVNFKTYHAINWEMNNYNTHIALYLKKRNQTIKFGLLIEYNMRNIFLQKSCSKYDVEPRPFSEKSKLSMSVDQQSEIIYSLLLLYVQVEDYQNILIETKVLTTSFYLI